MSLSKKVRFEVFKRDKFTCQYCGSTPPNVVLEVDHILPKSKQGKDDIDNLITSCFDCNRGKSNNLLTSIPRTIKEKSDKEEEKLMQLKEYNKILKRRMNNLKKQSNKISDIYNKHFEGFELSEYFINTSLIPFLKKIPFENVKEYMQIACLRLGRNEDAAIKYFCGICWRSIKND